MRNINKRIAKNTIMLYARMLITMMVSLYTSRVVLNALGVEDYGVYSVIGGFVVLLGFLNSAMAGATQRFMNVELGKNNQEALGLVFSSAIVIQICVAVVIIIFAETLGLWFLNSQMNINPSRMEAAGWVFQFSVFSFVAGILNAPYNASIIAHEKMSAFAYFSILEAFFKLSVAFAISYTASDRLTLYSFLLFIVSVAMRLAYGVYSKKNFMECSFSWKRVDKITMKQMTSFSAWTIIGYVAYVLQIQGIAILINLFFGAIVNASVGIAYQVNGVVRGFAGNIVTAMRPQIVQNYAVNEMKEMYSLISRGCRVTFFLILLFVLPLFMEIPVILHYWLGIVPDYTIDFIRLILLVALVDSFSTILVTAIGATGHVRKYQITISSILFMQLPITWISFKYGYGPDCAFFVFLILAIIMQLIRVLFVCHAIKYPLKSFCSQILYRCFLVVVFATLIPVVLQNTLKGSYFNSIIVIFVSIVSVLFCSLYIGFNRIERNALIKACSNKFKKGII